MSSNAPKAEQPKPATLGELIDALAGVIGHQVSLSLFQGTNLADALNKDPGQWSRIRNGRASAHNGELVRLLEIFGLERVLDYRVFHHSSVESFLAELRDKGVGVYGGSSRAKLLGFLATLARQSDCHIHIEPTHRPVTRGGFGKAKHNDRGIPTLKEGSRARIACTGPAGLHLLVFDAGPEDDIDILMPSRFAPETYASKKVMTLPTPASDEEDFDLEGKPGYYRLYAAWVDETVAQRAQTSIDPKLDTTRLSDPTATALHRLLESAEPGKRKAAVLDYRIVR